jgi:hypothetical protein
MPVTERTQILNHAGQIAVSDEAQAELGLVAGAPLTELVVDGMLVYVPTELAVERALDLDFERALDAFQREMAEHGISADDIVVDLEQHKDEIFRDFYPDVE